MRGASSPFVVYIGDRCGIVHAETHWGVSGLCGRLWWQERLLWVWEHLYDLWLPGETSDHLQLGSGSMHSSPLWRRLRLCTVWGQAEWWHYHLRLLCSRATTEVRCEHYCLGAWVSRNCLVEPVGFLWAVSVIVCSAGGACQMAGQAASNVPTSRAEGVGLQMRLLHLFFMFRIFFSGRLSNIVYESMERPGKVNDCVGARADFSQFIVKPNHCNRSRVSWVFALDSSTEEPRIRKSSRQTIILIPLFHKKLLWVLLAL